MDKDSQKERLGQQDQQDQQVDSHDEYQHVDVSKLKKQRIPNFLDPESDNFRPMLEEELLSMFYDILQEYKKYGDYTFRWIELSDLFKMSEKNYYTEEDLKFFEEDISNYCDFAEDITGCLSFIHRNYKKYDLNKIHFLKYLNYYNILNCIEERLNNIYS